MTLLAREGQTETWGNGFWRHPWLIRNVVGPDGRRRTVYLGPDADTFFSWPARMKVNGVWIKGYVSGPEQTEAGVLSGEPRFVPYVTQKAIQ
jgi:hypothetical protein